jgi:L-fuconolactonase
MAHVVDANVHVIAADRQRYPVSPRRGTLPSWAEGSTEEALEHMRAAGVDQAVLVHSAAIYGDDSRYTLDSANQFPERFAALVGVDVADPAAGETLNRLVAQHHIDGIRFERSDGLAASAWLDAPKTLPLWAEAARLGIFVALPTARKLEDVPALRRVLERFPTVRIALRQLLGVPCEDGPPYAGAAQLLNLAEFPNVYFSFSLDNIEAARRGKSTPQALFETFLDRFGADHLMWGSFYPAHRGPPEAPYAGVINRVREELAFLPEPACDWLLGETARLLFPAFTRGNVLWPN